MTKTGRTFTAMLSALACLIFSAASYASTTPFGFLRGPIGIFGKNVITNPGAEDSAGAVNFSSNVAPVSWVRTSAGGSVAASAVIYGISGGLASPGAPFGTNYFIGGVDTGATSQTLTQTIDLTTWNGGLSATEVAAIDAGSATFTVTAYLGGWSSQADDARVTVTFLDAGGTPVGSATTIGPVTAANRGNATTILLRSATGAVPTTTRQARVQIIFTKSVSYLDGCADNLTLTLN